MLRLLQVQVFVGLILAVQVNSENPRQVGQPSEERPATAEVKAMVAGLKGEIESSLAVSQGNGSNGPPGSVRISARSYRAQLVNGVNYFVRVKVRVGKSKAFYYHVKIYKSFSGDTQFVKMTGPKDRKDGIEYF